MLFLRVLYLISIAYCLRQYNEYCIANTVLPIGLRQYNENMKTCSTQHLLPWCCHRGSTQSASAHARLHSQTRQKNVSSCTCPLALSSAGRARLVQGAARARSSGCAFYPLCSQPSPSIRPCSRIMSPCPTGVVQLVEQTAQSEDQAIMG